MWSCRSLKGDKSHLLRFLVHSECVPNISTLTALQYAQRNRTINGFFQLIWFDWSHSSNNFFSVKKKFSKRTFLVLFMSLISLTFDGKHTYEPQVNQICLKMYFEQGLFTVCCIYLHISLGHISNNSQTVKTIFDCTYNGNLLFYLSSKSSPYQVF